MSELDLLAQAVEETRQLRSDLAQMKRHHLQVLCTLVHGLGGELRLTRQDYLNVPVGAALEVATDPATGDTLFRVVVPQEQP